MADPAKPSREALLGLAGVSGALRVLGPWRRDLAFAIGDVWYSRQSREQLERTAANHRRANPALTPRDSAVLARESYREYTAMIVDSIWGESLRTSRVRQYVHVNGEERLERTRDGAVFVVSHFGSWDMAASAALMLGLRVTTVMGPVVTPFFTSLVAWSRRRKGIELFSPERAARGLVRALRANRVVALMGDVPEAGPTVVVDFCGGPVRFSAVPARLAMSRGKPLFPVACWRAGGGWILNIGAPVVIGPDDDDVAVTARVARALEPFVLRHPEQWYPFHRVYEDS